MSDLDESQTRLVGACIISAATFVVVTVIWLVLTFVPALAYIALGSAGVGVLVYVADWVVARTRKK